MDVQEFLRREISRRQFLGRSAQNAAGMAASMVGLSGAVGRGAARQRVRVGVIGVRNRGRLLAERLAEMADVDVAVLCDVDRRLFRRACEVVRKAQGFVPRCETDFRRVLDDPSIHAVVIAVPDHWHALMTVLACQAGKDVYLEKPVTRTLGELPAVVRAIRDTGRVVQVGLQQRSGQHFQTAIELVRAGQIGKVRFARAWTAHRRSPMPEVKAERKPGEVDYEMWLGPARPRPFDPRRFHYHWRWFWEYGTGELGNWGVHLLDVALWGMEVGLPSRVVATGGTYHLDDGPETPDTLLVQYEYPDATLVWEHRQWSDHGLEGRSAAVAFYGDRGTLVVDRGGWKVYDCHQPRVGDTSEQLRNHLRDFINCVKTRRQPRASIQTALASTVLCHLGNIAFRLGRELRLHPDHLEFPDDPEAQELAQPAYSSAWTLPYT